jgi:diguanylate cyclase (GGDEF)-like protein
MTEATVKRRRISSSRLRRLIPLMLGPAALYVLIMMTEPKILPFMAVLLVAAYAVGVGTRPPAHGSGALGPDAAEVDLSEPAVRAVRAEIDHESGRQERLERLVERNRELTALYSLANAVGASLELREVVTVALEGIVKEFAVGAGEIAVTGAPDETLTVYCRQARIIAAYRGASAPRLSRKLASQAAKSGEPLVDRLDSDPPSRLDAAEQPLGVNQLAVFPIKTKGRTLGVLTLAFTKKRPITARDQELLGTIGSMVGAGIENSRLYQRLRQLSFTDPVTGLYNRRFIIKRLRAELERASRYDHRVSVIMVDVDAFKQLNDRFGHIFGDLALKKIALATRAACRRIDYIGRYGGDEFLIVLPETETSSAALVSDRVRRHINSLSLPVPAGAGPVSLTASLGLAVYPDSGGDATAVIMAADRRLYRAKRDGGDRLSA